MDYKLKDDKDFKALRSDTFNYNFYKDTGLMITWGRTINEDAESSPFGPTILDIEISTICTGSGKPCKFCYKSNSAIGSYMSADQFKIILDKLPPTTTQIAFGIGDIDSNPDLEKIFEMTDKKGIKPNITINGYRLTPKYMWLLKKYCGSVAVSRYDSNVCFDAVQRLTGIGLEQVNIHQVFHESTVKDCIKLINSVGKDKRLAKLNAVLFLMMKPKGRASNLAPVESIDSFKSLVDKALKKNISIGFDSCSAPLVLQCTKDHPQADIITTMIEPCESALFSSYINVNGEAFPCSFSEGEQGWETGIKITEETDYIKDIWNSERMNNWKNNLIHSSDKCDCTLKANCRSCPIFDITPCKRTKYED